MFPWNKFVCSDSDNILLFEKNIFSIQVFGKIIFKLVLKTQVFS